MEHRDHHPISVCIKQKTGPPKGAWLYIVKRAGLQSAFAVLLSALFIGIGSGWIAEAGEQARPGEASQAYRIPAGPLKEALSAFARQAGVRLSFDPALMAGKTTKGLSGNYSALRGLEKLLQGSGLKAVDKGSGQLEVTRLPKQEGGREVATVPGMKVWTQKENVKPGDYLIPIETLRRTMARDMADIFATEPSVSIGGGGRYSQRLYLRGVESNNLNITVDGASQGRSLHQHMGDIGSMAPDLLKRVEVEPGPGADRGPGALGGSIVFETVDAQDLLTEGKNLGATIRGSYASADESWLGSGSAYGVFDGAYGLLAHFSASEREDYRIGEGGEVPNTAGESSDYFVKFSMLDNARHDLRLSAERISDQGRYIWGSVGSDMGYPTEDSFNADYIKTKRETVTLDHRFNPASPWINTKLNVFYNDNSVKNDDRRTEYISDQIGGDVRNTFSFNLGATQHRLTVGADYRGEQSTGKLADGSEKENKSNNLGLFIQNRMSIGPLKVSFGARFDDYDSDFGPYTLSGSEISPNLGASYELLKGMSVFASYGEAVRGSGIIPGSWMTNIDRNAVFKVTEPESSRQIQGGMRYLVQNLIMAEDAFWVEGSVFNTRLENIIEAVGRRGVISAISNGEDLISQGFDLRVSWGHPKLKTTLGFTHVKTEDSDGNPVGTIRRKAGSSGDRLVWDNRWHPVERLTLGYTMNAVFRLTDVPAGYEERPGYVLHGIQVMWQPPWVPDLTLSLVVNNLFDVRYSEHNSMSGRITPPLDEPGLDVRLGFTYKF